MIIKSVIDKNKKTQFQDKFKFNDGSYTTDMKIICEKFNDFFLSMSVHPYPKRLHLKISVRKIISKQKLYILCILNLLLNLKLQNW